MRGITPFRRYVLSFASAAIILASLPIGLVQSFGDNVITHPYISREAAEIWSNEEIRTYLYRIEEGTWHEDEVDEVWGITTFGSQHTIPHFWDADMGDLDPVGGGLLGDFPNALVKARILWSWALSAYAGGNKEGAYHNLGHVAHLLQDMGVPAHVHEDWHAESDDCYEDWMDGTTGSNYMKWGHLEAILYQGGLIDIPVGIDPLYYLMYTTNQYADYFASDGVNGDTYDRNGWVNYAGWPSSPRTTGQLNDNDWGDNDDDGDLSRIAGYAYVYSMRATATLYRVFYYRATDQTAPTTTLSIGDPHWIDPYGRVHVTSNTPFTLVATDGPGGIGVAGTAYEISSLATSWLSGWQIVSGPFLPLTGLSDGNYEIAYHSWDYLGNREKWLSGNVLIVLDNTPPATTLEIGEPKYVDALGNTHVSPDTSIGLLISDADTSVIYRRIRNDTYDSGWLTGPFPGSFPFPFSLTGLSYGWYSIDYRSEDRLGNLEPVRTKSVYCRPFLTLKTTSLINPPPALVYRFSLSEIVYVFGEGYEASQTYPIYIVEDRDWRNGDSIPPRIDGTLENIETTPTGRLRVFDPGSGRWRHQAVWEPPLTVVGEYDIIIDVNRNGAYDEFMDALCDNNVGTAGFLISYFDYAPPRTTFWIGEPHYIDASGNWYVTSDTPLTLSATDELGGSGVNRTEYMIENVDGTYDSGWLESTGPFYLTELRTSYITFRGQLIPIFYYARLSDGRYRIWGHSVDYAGNDENPWVTYVNLDNTPPDPTLTIGAPKYIDASGKTYVTSDTPFTLDATDNLGGSGVNRTEYMIESMNGTYNSGWVENTEPFYLITYRWFRGLYLPFPLSDGEYVIYYRGWDCLGKAETGFQNITLDNTPPDTTLIINGPHYFDASGKISVPPGTSFAFNIDDSSAGAGVLLTRYRIHNEEYDSGWLSYSSGVSLAELPYGSYSMDYYSLDRLENIEPTNTDAIDYKIFLTLETTDTDIPDPTPWYKFNPSDIVYVFGEGYEPGQTYPIYVVEDRRWNDGDPIPPRISETRTKIEANEEGELLAYVEGKWRPQILWKAQPLTPGKYDIIIDVNGNEIFDAGIDALCDNNVQRSAGFCVVDATPPTTELNIGSPKYIDPDGNVYVASDTPFTLKATDDPDGSGVLSTRYCIHNDQYDSGWLTYSVAFCLEGLPYGTYSIDCYSLDRLENIEPTGTQTVHYGPSLPYDVTIDAYCNTEDAGVSVPISMDGTPTGHNTPKTFTGLTGTHMFTVPSSDSSGHPLTQWSTGETSTTITVSSEGTYIAYYEAPPVPPPTKYGLVIEVRGSGTTDPAPSIYFRDEGSVVSVDAVPDSGWMLRYWLLNGTNVGSTDPYSVTMNANYNLTAVFAEMPPPPPPPPANIWSSDSSGNPKDEFTPGETVYVTVPATGETVTLYIVLDKTDWNSGNPLTDVSDGAETLTLNIGPGTQTIPIWAPPLTIGKYDIVMDLDNNGLFDIETDLIDSVLITGFFVVPEVPFGTAAAFLSMLAALAGLKRFRPKVRQQ